MSRIMFLFLTFVSVGSQASFPFTMPEMEPVRSLGICDAVWAEPYEELPKPQVINHGVPRLGPRDRVLNVNGGAGYYSKYVVAENKEFILIQALTPTHELRDSLLVANDGDVVYISFEFEFKFASHLQPKVAQSLIEEFSIEVEKGGFFALRIVDSLYSLVGDFKRSPLGRVAWSRSYRVPVPLRSLDNFVQAKVPFRAAERKLLFHPYGDGILYTQTKTDETIEYAVLLLATGEARAVVAPNTREQVTDIPRTRALDIIERVYQRAALGDVKRAIYDFRELFMQEAPELLEGRWPDGVTIE